MGLLYKSEKRTIFKVVVVAFIALALLGATIRFWYVSVPVLLLLAWLLIALRNRNQRAVAHAREQVVIETPAEPRHAVAKDTTRPELPRSTVADLSSLAEMRSKGLLSEAEFDAAKHRLLAE